MLSTVTLHLARCPDFPDGSDRHGYELQLPLDADGRLSLETWAPARPVATFSRFWGDEDQQWGELKHRRQGWSLSLAENDESESIVGGDLHRFREGEYVSIKHDGASHTFKVVSVVQAANHA